MPAIEEYHSLMTSVVLPEIDDYSTKAFSEVIRILKARI